MLEGHKLALQLSMKKSTESQADSKSFDDRKNARATKIVVRNVAFEAKSQDVRSVFQPFGQVKSVRVPRKFDGSHRSESSACHSIYYVYQKCQLLLFLARAQFQ